MKHKNCSFSTLEIFRYFMSRLPPLKMETFSTDGSSPQIPRYNTRNSLPFANERRFVHEKNYFTMIIFSFIKYLKFFVLLFWIK